MKNILLKGLMALGLVAALVGCQDKGKNNYLGEYQSCVDFGGGCNYNVINEFQSQHLFAYPSDAQRRPEGVIQQNNGGAVYYSDLDGCYRRNSQTFYTYSNGDNLARFIPVELPRDGGLACLDSLMLDTSGNNPHNSYNYIDTALMLFSEYKMFGYYPQSYNQTPPVNSNLITKLINVQAGQNTGTATNNQGNYGFQSFAHQKQQAFNVAIPLVCDPRRGETNNEDCRGRTCRRIQNQYFQNSGNLGLCEY